MTYFFKAFVTCNKCGAIAESDSSYNDVFGYINLIENRPAEGWKRIKSGHHLCPACAERYDAIDEEMRLRLDDAAGIRRVEVELP